MTFRDPGRLVAQPLGERRTFDDFRRIGPAGKRDAEEAPAQTARRELAEEAGIEAGHWHALGSVLTTPGFCDERIHLYLARDLRRVPVQHQDNELIEIHWRPLTEALSWIETGQLQDAKTLLVHDPELLVANGANGAAAFRRGRFCAVQGGVHDEAGKVFYQRVGAGQVDLFITFITAVHIKA